MVMSLEFGLMITLLGVVSVFSALTLVAVACGMMKRVFKGERAEVAPPSVSAAATQLKEGEMSEEEEAAVAATIMAYMSEASPVPRLTGALSRETQPIIWNMAGRMDSMELQIKRGR